jgi:hypothetical protein
MMTAKRPTATTELKDEGMRLRKTHDFINDENFVAIFCG